MIRWYYAHPKTREQVGPCDEATVRAKYVDGELAPSALVWHEGLAEWIPARAAFGASPSAAPAGEAALPPRLCAWLLFDAWMFLLATLFVLPCHPQTHLPSSASPPCPLTLHLCPASAQRFTPPRSRLSRLFRAS